MNDRGFTLMETLVAFAVFSMASVALLDAYAQAGRARLAADANTHLARRAAGLLAEAELLAGEGRLREGSDPDGTLWQVRIDPAEGNLMRLSVHLKGRHGREAVFQTLRSRSELGLEEDPE